MYGHQKDPTLARSCRSFKPNFIAHSSSAKCFHSVQFTHIQNSVQPNVQNFKLPTYEKERKPKV